MPVNAIWSIGSTELVEWLGAKDELTGAFLNNLVITMDITDEAGDVVSGGDDLPLANVAGSNGNYKGSIPNTVTAAFGVGDQFTATITAKSSGDEFRGVRKITRVAECQGPTS